MHESILRHAASCTICIILAFFFACVGLAKLVAPAAAQQTFAHWGHPDWFPLFVGALELTGAVLLLHRRTTTFAAAILAGVMLGAVATHLRSQEVLGALLPASLLVPIACVGYCRRLDATWMRRFTTRRRAQLEFDDGFLADPFPTLPRPVDASFQPGLRIMDRSHADVPDPFLRGGDHQRRA